VINSNSNRASCGSRAPWYFTPKRILHKQLDHIQFTDRGLWFNNPINPLIWKAKRIWPGARPDVVVSIGTGHCDAIAQSGGDSLWSLLGKVFMGHIDQERIWMLKRNEFTPKEMNRYHRLTVGLSMEPSLDDISGIQQMKEQTAKYIAQSNIIDTTARHLKAALFYFELKQDIKYVGGYYQCLGYIRCQLPMGSVSLKHLANELVDTEARFSVNGGPKFTPNNHITSGIRKGGIFLQEIHFKVRSFQEAVNVTLVNREEDGFSISDCPFNMNFIRVQQGLNQLFGNDDHSLIDFSNRKRRPSTTDTGGKAKLSRRVSK